MTNTSLATVAAKALPALSGESLTYNAAKNVFLSQGYTSAAGNMYYKAIRLSNHLIVYYDIGQGYFHSFLNGISLYSYNGTSATLIAKKQWGGYGYRIFNELSARDESIQMLKEYLSGQAKLMNQNIDERSLLEFARNMVNETQQKCLA